MREAYDSFSGTLEFDSRLAAQRQLGEFQRRHGECVSTGKGMLLFEDGALAPENGDYRYHQEPPTDRKQLLELRREFHKIKAQQAESVFDRLSAYLQGTGPSFTYPSSWFPDFNAVHDEAALKWFAAEHARHVDAIQKIDDEIANLPEEVAHRRAVEEAKRLEERMNQQLQQQRSRIASIALQRPRI